MTAFRRVPALHRRMLPSALLLALAVCPIAAIAQSTQIKEPDDTKPVSITGCLTARTQSGGFILSSVFARPITVIGPNYLQAGMGHQVTLKGTWQTSGIAPESGNAALPRVFVVSEVKVDARQCSSPPSAPDKTGNKPAKTSGGN